MTQPNPVVTNDARHSGHKAMDTGPHYMQLLNKKPPPIHAATEAARPHVGTKGHITNIPADVMPASEVIASYHDLWRVEQSFRMSKSDLRARPVFHHERDAIEAHMTVVVTALAVARHLQELTGLSLKKIIWALRPLQEITLTIAGHEHLAADPLTPAAKHILKSTAHPQEIRRTPVS